MSNPYTFQLGIKQATSVKLNTCRLAPTLKIGKTRTTPIQLGIQRDRSFKVAMGDVR